MKNKWIYIPVQSGNLQVEALSYNTYSYVIVYQLNSSFLFPSILNMSILRIIGGIKYEK